VLLVIEKYWHSTETHSDQKPGQLGPTLIMMRVHAFVLLWENALHSKLNRFGVGILLDYKKILKVS
jgi:hypothetical protein